MKNPELDRYCHVTELVESLHRYVNMEFLNVFDELIELKKDIHDLSTTVQAIHDQLKRKSEPGKNYCP